MARKNRRRRETSAFSNLNKLPFSMPIKVQTFAFNPLAQIEDRRTWHPEGFERPARMFSSPRHRLTLVGNINRPVGHPQRFSGYSGIHQTKARIAFVEPQRVLVCVRRKQRREVLHALRKTGFKGQRPPRRNFYSSVRCS